MSLRRKVLLLTAVSLVALVALIYLVAVAALLAGFGRAERQQMDKRVTQVHQLLARRLRSLDGTCHDWSSWDETYRYVRDRNAAYRQANLSLKSLRNVHLDLMAAMDESGEVVFAGWADAAQGVLARPPAGLVAALGKGGRLANQLHPGQPAQGFAAVSGAAGPVLMLAARPVLRSDDLGPSRGWLVVGVALAAEELTALEAGTGLAMELSALSGGQPDQRTPALPLDELVAPCAVLSRPEGPHTIAGYSVLRGLSGEPVAVLRVSDYRDLYQHGWKTVHFMVAPVIVCGAALSLLLLLLLEREVLSRIARLSADVAAAGQDEALAAEIALSGDDELTALAADISTTLTALARSRARVQEQQEMDRAITESVPLGLLVIDQRCRVLAANPQVRRWFAVPEGSEPPLCPEVLGSEAGCGPCAACTALQAYDDGQVHERDWTTRGRDGSTRHYRSLFAPVRDAAGRARRMLIVITDETYHLQLEGRLRQRARDEAIGRFASGIAHDFNNLLTVIMSSLNRRLPEAPRPADIAAAYQAAKRAAGLTTELLALSRREAPTGGSVQFSELVGETVDLLRQFMPESVSIKTRLASDLWPVSLDPAQAQQVLTNLITNARDAMPHGGTLTIATENLALGNPLSLERQTVPAGDYVVVTVADNGAGISPDALEHIFEPYFSTKGNGHGTGLGLPLVAAAVERAGGHIAVEAAPGSGSIFRLYLPRGTRPPADEPTPPAAPAPAAEPAPEGWPRALHGTVLMAEDNAMVRDVGVEVLEAAGLQVLAAGSGEEALGLLETAEGIDLLFTDVVMPGMSGPELAREVQQRLPGVPVLFASGYTDGRVAEAELAAAGRRFLAKPYDPSSLLSAVEGLLGDAGQSASAGAAD